jgi:hypothetical protein
MRFNFSLERGGTKRLRLAPHDGDRWSLLYDGALVRDVARVPNVRQTATLPDGTELALEWRPGFVGIGTGWDITRNGAPLPGTVGDPMLLAANAAAVFFFLGALHLFAAVGGLRLLGVPTRVHPGVSTAVMAAILFFFGWRIHRGSYAALSIGTWFYAVNMISALVYRVTHTHGMGDVGLPAGLLLAFALFVPIARALPALRRAVT